MTNCIFRIRFQTNEGGSPSTCAKQCSTCNIRLKLEQKRTHDTLTCSAKFIPTAGDQHMCASELSTVRLVCCILNRILGDAPATTPSLYRDYPAAYIALLRARHNARDAPAKRALYCRIARMLLPFSGERHLPPQLLLLRSRLLPFWTILFLLFVVHAHARTIRVTLRHAYMRARVPSLHLRLHRST